VGRPASAASRGRAPQELAVASREAEALLRSISESTAVAEKEKAKVAVIVGEVSSKAAEIAAVKDDAERDLAAAKPALDDALAALNRCASVRFGACIMSRRVVERKAPPHARHWVDLPRACRGRTRDIAPA
jgi:hypothetical protein